MINLEWPKQDIRDFDLHDGSVLFVTVTTPDDQSELHRYLALLGYIPVLLEEDRKINYWRFHHPNGEKIQ